MCGRFAFFSPADAIAAAFGTEPSHEFAPRYNIAPTQDVPVLMSDADGQRVWGELHWGLVPFWAKDPAIGNRMINARAETVAEKPSYRQALSRRRCIVPASGFYEWRKDDDGKKTPWYISRADGQPLAMAGIWELWDKGEQPLRSFSIITTAANDFMHELHHRMPAILEKPGMDVWMAGTSGKDELLTLINSPVTAGLQAWPVSRAVNSPLNDHPELLERVG